MKKNILAILVLIIIALAMVFFLRQNNTSLPEAILKEEIKLYAYLAEEVNTGQLSVSIPFNKQLAEDYQVDLAVDWNNDGQWSADEWVWKDLAVHLVQGLRNNFYLADEQNRLAADQEVGIKINLKKVGSNDLLETLEQKVKVEGVELEQAFGFNVPGAAEDLKRGIGLPQAITQIAYAQDNSEIFREAMTPDLAQGRMECAAVSTANNLMSLAGQYDRLADLPEFTGELIEELKRDMKFNNGILLPNMVPGKNAFVARHNLPIASELKTAPTLEQIRQALASGAAIELSMNFTRSRSGRAATGHVVTLVGVSGNQVFVHDSGTPEGMDALDITSTVRTKVGDFVGVNYPLWDGVAYIDGIVIQNWTEAQRANESYTDAGEQASEVEMLVINGSYFPKSQFKVAGADACDASHYHSHQPVWGLRAKDSTEVISLMDPLPNACGFGKISEVPVEKITISFEQSTALLQYLP